jgi:hypothetical protein
MCAKQLQIGFWSRRELKSLEAELADVFSGASFSRQIVHRWESLHCSTPGGLYVDVSRTRTDEHGEYDRPIVVTVAYERAAAAEKEVRAVAKAIAARLGIEVSVGTQVSKELAPYEYDFEVRESYRANG